MTALYILLGFMLVAPAVVTVALLVLMDRHVEGEGKNAAKLQPVPSDDTQEKTCLLDEFQVNVSSETMALLGIPGPRVQPQPAPTAEVDHGADASKMVEAEDIRLMYGDGHPLVMDLLAAHDQLRREMRFVEESLRPMVKINSELEVRAEAAAAECDRLRAEVEALRNGIHLMLESAHEQLDDDNEIIAMGNEALLRATPLASVSTKSLTGEQYKAIDEQFIDLLRATPGEGPPGMSEIRAEQAFRDKVPTPGERVKP